MNKNANILLFTSLVIILVSWISASYKTGFSSYSVQSLFKRDQPKYMVDKAKIGRFAGLICVAFVANCLYALAFTREIAAILMISAFNTLFITYALTYWVLLKDKKH